MSNQTNFGFSLDSLLKLFGSSWTLDVLIVYINTPVCLFGIFSNIVCYFILRKKAFHSALIFKYLRINVLNSIFVSIVLSTSLLGTYRIFSFTNTYASFFYSAYFYGFLLPMSYLYGNLLDICTILERIAFSTKTSLLVKFIKEKYVPLLLLAISVIINLPMLFVCYPTFADFPLNDGSMYRIHFWGQTEFQTSLYGKIILYLVYFIRDIATLLSKIILNFISVWIMRRYFKKLNNNGIIAYSLRDERVDSTKKLAQETKNKIERNLTYISIIMSIFSSMENIFNLVSLVYIIFFYNETAFYLFFLAHLSIALKHSTNVFVLYFFNHSFKVEFKNLFFKC